MRTERESLPCPSPATALEKVSSVLDLGSRIELALVAGAAAEPSQKVLERERASGLTCSDTSQAQIQGFELAHPNIYTIDGLLECVNGSIPQNQNYRISITQGNNRMSRKSPNEEPVLLL